MKKRNKTKAKMAVYLPRHARAYYELRQDLRFCVILTLLSEVKGISNESKARLNAWLDIT